MKILEFGHMQEKKYLLLFIIMQENKLFGKKLISECNKITKISLRGICQIYL